MPEGGPVLGMAGAWLIPAFSVIAFVIVGIFGKYLPKQGSFISIIAIFAGFVLFWFVLSDMLSNGPGHFSFDWLVVGETHIGWGMRLRGLCHDFRGNSIERRFCFASK